METYAVFQEDFDSIPFDILRDVLVEHGGMTRIDAGQTARRARGILTDRLSNLQAAKVCGALRTRGFAVRATPTSQLPPLSKGEEVSELNWDENGLTVRYGVQSLPGRIDWSGVFVVSAGRIAETKERRVEVVEFNMDDNAELFGPEYETQRYSEYVQVTQLIGMAQNGRLLSLRIPALGLNYAALLGVAATSSYFECYLHVLEQIVARCEWAIVSPETHALLKQRRKNAETRQGDYYEHREERQFANYNRWLVQLAIIREKEEQSG